MLRNRQAAGPSRSTRVLLASWGILCALLGVAVASGHCVALAIAGAEDGKMHAAHGGALGAAQRREVAAVTKAVGGLFRGASDLPGLALDAGAGVIYWTDFSADRIRRADRDGSAVRDLHVNTGDTDDTVVGPIGIAIDAAGGKIYWTSDPDFPRKLQRADLDGDNVEDLVSGEDLNRPCAIAVDASAGKIYWTESVSGKLRRANLDGSSVEDLLTTKLMASFGLALDLDAGKIYWTDFASSTIERVDLDGGDREQLVTATQGLDAPMGLALDVAAGKMYWADQGSEKIQRANLDGFDIEDLVTSADGLIKPQGLTLDVKAAKMYWTDAGTGKLQRADVDGSEIEDLVVADAAASLPGPSPKGSLAVCTAVAAAAGDRFKRRTIKALSTCLEKVSWVKAVKWRITDETAAAATCLSQFRLLRDTRDDHPGAERRLREALMGACDPQSHDHAFEELAGAQLVGGCSAATVASTSEWVACTVDAYQRAARAEVAGRYSRAGEWLEAVRPFVAATRAPSDDPTRIGDALAALDAFHAAVVGAPLEDRPVVPTRRWLLGTGQTTTYAAVKRGEGRFVAVPEDGTLQSGGLLAFVDNRDGTVTDLNTGLMWEKKCDRCRGLHDYGLIYAWSGDGGSDAIWDWLDQVNAEGGVGFAGYDDWRIPSIKELISIIDYERFNPSASADFDAADCGLGCVDVTDPDCSCTAMSFYWTATTFADFPAHALTVTFNLGLVGDLPKTHRIFVRAVRGGR